MPKSTESEIAVLQTQMSAVQQALEAVRAEQSSNFKALAGKIDNLSSTPLEISSIKADIEALKRAKARDWVWKTMSGATGAALAALLFKAFSKG